MGGFSIWHWLLVLIIIVLIFGTRKIKDLGKDIGESVRSFKQALNEEKPQDKITLEKKDDDSK
ncbi:MAG: Sec-independent protein translocase subunit TatA [Burkholderiales bacterium]|nr:Sec-independent protein translocase subunit TatA [Burkholderiales bacterium]